MERPIPKVFKEYFEDSSQFDYYHKYKQLVRAMMPKEDFFLSIKGLSSSTPLINSAAFRNETLGGGFYFCFKGLGIVVDPGIGFVTQMHDNNIFIDDIDMVIVTHDHLDHNADVNAIASLLSDYNGHFRRKSKFYRDFFPVSDHEHHIEWYMDSLSIVHNRDYLEKEYIHDLTDLADGRFYEVFEGLVDLKVFHTEHVKQGNEFSDGTFGVNIRFHDDDVDYVWGYTSDTHYFPELVDYLDGCDVCILNISDIYPRDVQGIEQKGTHLGYDGCKKIIEEIDCNLFLISEFCGTKGDVRCSIVRSLREELACEECNKYIFPTESGVCVELSGRKVQCSICERMSDLSKVKVVRPAEEFGKIGYICSECMM